MFDRVLTVLLLFGLLACPVRCASGSAEFWTDGSKDASVCSCCQHDSALADQDRSSGAPRPVEQDCGCTDCLCEGAISGVASQRDMAIDLAEGASVELASRLQWLDRLAQVHAPAFWLSDTSTGWYRTGRETRVAHQSFLI